MAHPPFAFFSNTMKICFRYASHYIKLGAERILASLPRQEWRRQPEYGNWASHRPCVGTHPRLRGETSVISSRAFRLSLQRGLETRKEVFKVPLNPVSRELGLDTFMRFSWERNQGEGWRSNSCMTLKPCLPPRKLQADHRHWLCSRNSCPLPGDHLE